MQMTYQNIKQIFSDHISFSDISLYDMLNTFQGQEPFDEISFFWGRRWTEITSDILHEHSSAFFFFSPFFYSYYIPAVIASSIFDFDKIFDSISIIVLNIVRFKNLDNSNLWLSTYGSLQDEKRHLFIFWIEKNLVNFMKYGYEDDVFLALEIMKNVE